MPRKHDFNIGDDVVIPSSFARHKFKVPDDEVYTIDKLIDDERIQVSIDRKSFIGHYSHFSLVE